MYDFVSRSRVFISHRDAFRVPVRPVDGVLKQRDGKRMRQTFRDDLQ